ncbi:hypothetical protein ACEU07_21060 [Chromobacterium violaceum]|uniref:hypothetical protein n=1 Tax=Chromobacterium violaceum TaxID=536 RepID=UPI0035A66918
MKPKKLVRHIVDLLTTPRFNRFTHNAFGFLLLLTNTLVPTGIHRVWMGWKHWWIFPVLASIGIIGFFETTFLGSAGWRLLALPYAIFYIIDAWALFAPEEKGESINA